MRNPITSAMASDLPSVLLRSSSRLLKDSLQPSLPGLHAGYVQSGSDTIFGRSAIFRATMLVVGLLLLVLVCIARWESILHCLFCHRFFSARPPALQQQQQLPREMQKAWSKVEAVPVERYSNARAQECRGGVITECMICLNEFSEGELIRILPKCSHYFHMQCVDLWLVCHLSCPICRKNIADTLPFSFKRPAPSPPQLAV